jgi:hypothetical protein
MYRDRCGAVWETATRAAEEQTAPVLDLEERELAWSSKLYLQC